MTDQTPDYATENAPEFRFQQYLNELVSGAIPPMSWEQWRDQQTSTLGDILDADPARHVPAVIPDGVSLPQHDHTAWADGDWMIDRYGAPLSEAEIEDSREDDHEIAIVEQRLIDEGLPVQGAQVFAAWDESLIEFEDMFGRDDLQEPYADGYQLAATTEHAEPPGHDPF